MRYIRAAVLIVVFVAAGMAEVYGNQLVSALAFLALMVLGYGLVLVGSLNSRRRSGA